MKKFNGKTCWPLFGVLALAVGLMLPAQAFCKQKFPAGKWWIDANNNKGELYLAQKNGTIFKDPIVNVTFDEKTGELHFFRQSSGQQYSGTVTGNQINGTFTQAGKTFAWKAWKDESSAAGSKNFPAGKWWIDANNNKGELHLSPGGGKIFNDPITGTAYDKKTHEVRFTRPRSNQHYRGTVTGNQINGTFTQAGKTFAWRAWRAN